jgi:hypothetical protein
MQISENMKLGALLAGVGTAIIGVGTVSFQASKNAAYLRQKDALRPVTEHATPASDAFADAADPTTKAKAA